MSTPDNGWDTGRKSAEAIHDAARAQTARLISEAETELTDRIVEWVQKNTVNSLNASAVRKMKKELEIGVHRAPSAPKPG